MIEYKVIEKVKRKEIENTLNLFAQENWELDSIDVGKKIIILKREDKKVSIPYINIKNTED